MPAPEAREHAARWLRYARDDLQAARVLQKAREAHPRQVAWHAQQAAEKAIKAVLVAEQIAFPFTHDLEALHTLVPDGTSLRDASLDLASLTRWAVRARYPTFDDEVTEQDAVEAEALAAGIVRLADEDFERGGGS